MKTIFALVCLPAAALVCAALPPAAVRAANWEFNSAVNYDSGRYGLKDRTASVYIPFTLKRNYSSADLSVTVPYLRQSSKGRITRVGGKPVRIAGGNGVFVDSAESGLGDILLRGAYTLKLDGPKSFDLGLVGRLKLPTADKNKGLGTGEMDEGVGLDFAKEINPGLTLLADGYYTIIGDTDEVDFNNEVSLEVGFYTLLRKNLGLTVLYETQSALVNGNADPRSVSGTLSCGAQDGIQFAGGLTLGMSGGSPALSIGAGFSRKF